MASASIISALRGSEVSTVRVAVGGGLFPAVSSLSILDFPALGQDQSAVLVGILFPELSQDGFPPETSNSFGSTEEIGHGLLWHASTDTSSRPGAVGDESAADPVR